MELVNMKQCAVVFEFGEAGDFFYVVLEGSVVILLPENPPEFVSTRSMPAGR
jgi:hypothetical protein